MAASSRTSHLRAVGAALLVTLLWSSSWVLIRWGLDDEALPPLMFAALRYMVAAATLTLWVAGRRATRRAVGSLDRPMWVRLGILGLVFYALNQGAAFVAIDNQPAATTSLVLSWTPLVVALISGVALAERPTARQVLGAVLVVVGALMFFLGDLGASVVGMVAALVALGANAVSSLLGRSVNRSGDVDPAIVTTVSMVLGAIALFAVAAPIEGWPAVSGRAWIIIVWLAVVNTAFAFTLWNLSLQRLSALESAAINNTMVIQIAVLAWIFLSEPLGVGEVAGIVLVSIGVVMTQRVLTRRSPG